MKHNVYFDGRVESLGLDTAAGYATVGVITPGTYTFPTEFEEHVRVTSGVLRFKLDGVFLRTLRSLLAAARLGLPLAVFSGTPPLASSHALFLAQLRQRAAYVWKLTEDEPGLGCRCEKAPAGLPNIKYFAK